MKEIRKRYGMNNSRGSLRSVGVGYFESKRLVRRRRIAYATTAFIVLAGGAVLANVLRDRDSCALVLAGDRSKSSKREILIDQRVREARGLLRDNRDCSQVVIASIKSRPGESKVWAEDLDGTGASHLEKLEDERANETEALTKIGEIFRSPAGGATNYIAVFHEIDEQVSPPQIDTAEVWFFGDGINTVPIDFTKADLSAKGIDELISRLRPLPDCAGWTVNFAGVNMTRRGGVRDEIAQGAERFWRAWVDACGGAFGSYSQSVPAG